MKHKTLFRLLLKGIGVWVFVSGVGTILGYLSWIGYYFTDPGQGPGQGWQIVLGMVAPLAQMGLGAYLFFDGKWVADKAIPGNRPYCHECGYDLTGAAGDTCAECGTPFRVPAGVAPAALDPQT